MPGPILTLVRLIAAAAVGTLLLMVIRLDALPAAARGFFIATLAAGTLGYVVPILGMVVPIGAGVVFLMGVVLAFAPLCAAVGVILWRPAPTP